MDHGGELGDVNVVLGANAIDLPMNFVFDGELSVLQSDAPSSFVIVGTALDRLLDRKMHVAIEWHDWISLIDAVSRQLPRVHPQRGRGGACEP